MLNVYYICEEIRTKVSQRRTPLRELTCPIRFPDFICQLWMPAEVGVGLKWKKYTEGNKTNK